MSKFILYLSKLFSRPVNEGKALLFSSTLIAIVPFVFIASKAAVLGYTEFFILNPHRLTAQLNAWQNINLGANWGINIWRFFPLDIFYNFSNYFLHLAPHVTHATFLSTIFLFGFLSFYYFLKEYFSEIDLLPRLLGAFLFVFNVFTQLHYSSSYIFLIPYFFIPLQLLLVSRGIRREKPVYYGAILAISTSLMFGINLAFSAIAIALITAFSLFEAFMTNRDHLKNVVTLVVTFVAFSIGLASWWLIPMVYSNLIYSQNTSYVLNSERFNNLDSSIPNVLRNLGEWSFFGQYKGGPYKVYASRYSDNSIVYITSFLPLIGLVVAASIVTKDQKIPEATRKRLVMLLAMVCLFLPIIGGTNSSWFTDTAIDWFFNNIPMAMVFRSTYKFTEITVFCYVILNTYLLYWLYQRWNSPKIRAIIVTCFFVITIINTYPTWSNHLFDQRFQIDKLPGYWTSMANYVNKNLNPLTDRILLLPDQYFPVYKWNGKQKSLPSDPTEIIFNTPTVHGTCNGCATYYSSQLINYSLKNYGNKGTDKFLGLIGVSHILERKDVDYKYYDKPSPQEIQKATNNYSTIKLQKTEGPLDLYAIDKSIVNPRIYAASSLTTVENFDGALHLLNESRKSTDSFVIQNTLTEANQKQVTSPNIFIELFRDDNSTVEKNVIKQKILINQPSRINIQNLNKNTEDIRIIDTKKQKIAPNGNVYLLSKGEFTVEKTLKIDSRNLIVNGSFENGLWQTKVGNCKDDNPEAKLSMSYTKDGTEGRRGLKLNASADTACTQSNTISGWPIGSEFVLNFDYKLLKGQYASYCVWDGTDCLNSKMLTSQAPSTWTHATIPIRTTLNHNLTIYLYAPSVDSIESSVIFDNVSFNKILTPSIKRYVLKNNDRTYQNQMTIKSIYSSSLSKYIADLTIPQNGISLLNFSESFHPGWKAVITSSHDKSSSNNSSYSIDESSHIVTNGFSNGWLIDTSKFPESLRNSGNEYSVTISYKPQHLLNEGILISVATLLICGLTIFITKSYIKYEIYRRYN